MSVYNFKPEVCKKVLEDIAEEILETLLTNKVQNHGFVRLQSNIEDVKTKRQDIDGCLWEHYNISEKMSRLEELVTKQKGYDQITTGSIKNDLNYYAGMSLLKQKEELKTEISKLREEASSIEDDINKMVSVLTKNEQQLRNASTEV